MVKSSIPINDEVDMPWNSKQCIYGQHIYQRGWMLISTGGAEKSWLHQTIIMQCRCFGKTTCSQEMDLHWR